VAYRNSFTSSFRSDSLQPLTLSSRIYFGIWASKDRGWDSRLGVGRSNVRPVRRWSVLSYPKRAL